MNARPVQLVQLEFRDLRDQKETQDNLEEKVTADQKEIPVNQAKTEETGLTEDPGQKVKLAVQDRKENLVTKETQELTDHPVQGDFPEKEEQKERLERTGERGRRVAREKGVAPVKRVTKEKSDYLVPAA